MCKDSQEIANADNSEEKCTKQKYEKHISEKLTNYIRCNLKRCRKMKNIRGTDSVEELLNKMKKGEQLSVGNGICENICQFI